MARATATLMVTVTQVRAVMAGLVMVAEVMVEAVIRCLTLALACRNNTGVRVSVSYQSWVERDELTGVYRSQHPP
jgi:hypothetical protein